MKDLFRKKDTNKRVNEKEKSTPIIKRVWFKLLEVFFSVFGFVGYYFDSRYIGRIT